MLYPNAVSKKYLTGNNICYLNLVSCHAAIFAALVIFLEDEPAVHLSLFISTPSKPNLEMKPIQKPSKTCTFKDTLKDTAV
jgi:hypothetical protein